MLDINQAELEKSREKAEKELRNMKDSLEMLNRRLEEIRENERAAISREIHDHLGQSLTALKIDIQHIQDKMPDGSPEARKLESMSGLVTEMIRDVQRIAAELRPAILDDLGLASAMEWYIREFGKRTGITCRHRLDFMQFSDTRKNLTLYRILQEALTNVSRHASASMVQVDLFVKGNAAVMTVKDDGAGFDESKIHSFNSLGFIGIRERLKLTGGRLDIESRPGKGTKLSVSIPFD
jgi:signal transduction histidine kinase